MAKPNTVEKRHMAAVASLGCIICRRPAGIHHVRAGNGLGQRDHMRVIPLCPVHHQYGGIGVAIHAGMKTWEKKFGTETELLEKVRLAMEDIQPGARQVATMAD